MRRELEIFAEACESRLISDDRNCNSPMSYLVRKLGEETGELNQALFDLVSSIPKEVPVLLRESYRAKAMSEAVDVANIVMSIFDNLLENRIC